MPNRAILSNSVTLSYANLGNSVMLSYAFWGNSVTLSQIFSDNSVKLNRAIFYVFWAILFAQELDSRYFKLVCTFLSDT